MSGDIWCLIFDPFIRALVDGLSDLDALVTAFADDLGIPCSDLLAVLRALLPIADLMKAAAGLSLLISLCAPNSSSDVELNRCFLLRPLRRSVSLLDILDLLLGPLPTSSLGGVLINGFSNVRGMFALWGFLFSNVFLPSMSLL